MLRRRYTFLVFQGPPLAAFVMSMLRSPFSVRKPCLSLIREWRPLSAAPERPWELSPTANSVLPYDLVQTLILLRLY